MPRQKAADPKTVVVSARKNDQPDREETLRYLAEMAGELASIAGAARMPMLTYFLNMARVEAEMQIAEDARPSKARRTD